MISRSTANGRFYDRVNLETTLDPFDLRMTPDGELAVESADLDKVQERMPFRLRRDPPPLKPYGNELDPRGLPESPRRTFG